MVAGLFFCVVVGAEVGAEVLTGTWEVVAVVWMPVTVAPPAEITFSTEVEFAAFVTAVCSAEICAVRFTAPPFPPLPAIAAIAEELGKKTVITTWKATAARLLSVTTVTLTVLGSTPRDDATLLAIALVSTVLGSPVIAMVRVTVAAVVVVGAGVGVLVGVSVGVPVGAEVGDGVDVLPGADVGAEVDVLPGADVGAGVPGADVGLGVGAVLLPPVMLPPVVTEPVVAEPPPVVAEPEPVPEVALEEPVPDTEPEVDAVLLSSSTAFSLLAAVAFTKLEAGAVQVSPKTWEADTKGESKPFPPKTTKFPDTSTPATPLERAPGAEKEPREAPRVPKTYCQVLEAMSNFQRSLVGACFPLLRTFPPNMYNSLPCDQEEAECTPPGVPCPPTAGYTAFLLVELPEIKVHALFLNCHKSLKTTPLVCPP